MRTIETIAGMLCVACLGCHGDEPADTIEIKGARYERITLEDLREIGTPVGEASEQRPGGALRLAGPAPAGIGDWSQEDLAWALRPAVVRDGEIYVATEPAEEAAAAISSGDTRQVIREWAGPREGRPAPASNPEFRAIIGTDGRAQPDTTQYPWSAIARVELFHHNVDMGWCTGFFVGPYTFVTSAHCLWDEHSTFGTIMANRFRFQPGRHGLDVPHEFICDLTDGDPANDFYNFGFPAGYVGAGIDAGENPLDYAVIDVWPCINGAPSFFPYYFVNSGTADYGVYGYPEDSCAGMTGGEFFQCGMTGPAHENSGIWIETEHIDVAAAQSGGPWYRTDLVVPAGISQGWRSYFDFWQCGFSNCSRNFARRIDWGVDQFIRDLSWDF